MCEDSISMVHFPPCAVLSCSTSSGNADNSGFPPRDKNVRALSRPSSFGTLVSWLFSRFNCCNAARSPSDTGKLVSWLLLRSSVVKFVSLPSCGGMLVMLLLLSSNSVRAVSRPSSAGKLISWFL